MMKKIRNEIKDLLDLFSVAWIYNKKKMSGGAVV